MSVRFYNTRGWMIGVEFHNFQAVVPPATLPVSVPCHPHIAAVRLSWGLSSEASVLPRVTADGAPMLQKDHKIWMVPHMFVPCALPHLLEAEQLALVILGSKSTCVMSVASVTGGGKALATCLAGWWGLNVNCSAPMSAPSGNVFNPNTVRTTPTRADYVNAAIDVAQGYWEDLLELALGTSKAGKFFKEYRKLNKDPYIRLMKELIKEIEKVWGVDSSAVDKKIQKKREELVRKLLGGH